MFDDVIAVLERTKPAVSDSPVIRRELATLSETSRVAGRLARRRRMWRIGIPALSIALAIGGLSAANAFPAQLGFLGTHPHVTMALPWSTKNNCVNTAYIGASTQSPTGPASAATISAARKYIKQIDFDNIRNTRAWKTASAEAATRAALFPNAAGAGKTTENFEQYVAYSNIVTGMITSKLKSEGIDTTGLVIMGGTSCHKAGK
jgi:hypothetical protein